MRSSTSILLAGTALVLVTLAGCSGGDALSCGSTAYTTSQSAPPLRVPDNLTLPDESEALLIPSAGAPAAHTDATDGDQARCLVRPPDYSPQGKPSA